MCECVFVCVCAQACVFKGYSLLQCVYMHVHTICPYALNKECPIRKVYTHANLLSQENMYI